MSVCKFDRNRQMYEDYIEKGMKYREIGEKYGVCTDAAIRCVKKYSTHLQRLRKNDLYQVAFNKYKDMHHANIIYNWCIGNGIQTVSDLMALDMEKARRTTTISHVTAGMIVNIREDLKSNGTF